RARVCIATDVAARGLDLPNLGLVIHADLPNNSEALLHRSGRTGRAGRKGVSVLIVPQNRRKKAERLLGGARINAEWASAPSASDINARDEERLMSHAALTELVTGNEQALVDKIIAEHGAEQAAVAFVRLSRAGQSAPEELQGVAVGDVKKPAPRKEFPESIWVSLAVGYKQNAEPRWLIPRLCEAGNITNKEIGAIKIKDEETYVQLTAASADGFFNALGPDASLEDGIKVVRLQGAPAFISEPGGRPSRGKPSRDKFHGDKSGGKKPFSAKDRARQGDSTSRSGDKYSDSRSDSRGDSKSDSKPDYAGRPKFKGGAGGKDGPGGKPSFAKGRGKPIGGKPSGGKSFGGKPGGKSGGKPSGGKKRGPRT
ncbi:MAG: ATP-dependent RNA helicase, partial [Hyphomicrobiales bacterium]